MSRKQNLRFSQCECTNPQPSRWLEGYCSTCFKSLSTLSSPTQASRTPSPNFKSRAPRDTRSSEALQGIMKFIQNVTNPIEEKPHHKRSSTSRNQQSNQEEIFSSRVEYLSRHKAPQAMTHNKSASELRGPKLMSSPYCFDSRKKLDLHRKSTDKLSKQYKISSSIPESKQLVRSESEDISSTRQRFHSFHSKDFSLEFLCVAHRNTVTDLCFTKGKLWSVGLDYTLHGWNIMPSRDPYFTVMNSWKLGNTISPLISQRVHSRGINSIEHIDSGLMVTGGSDNMIKLWKLSRGIKGIWKVQGHEGSVTCLGVASPRSLLSGGSEGKIKVWDVESRKIAKEYEEDFQKIECLKMYSPSTFMSGCSDSKAKLWDIRTARSISSFTDHNGPVTCIELWDDYSFYTGGLDYKIRVSST